MNNCANTEDVCTPPKKKSKYIDIDHVDVDVDQIPSSQDSQVSTRRDCERWYHWSVDELADELTARCFEEIADIFRGMENS